MMPICLSVFPIVSCSSFKVSGLTLRSLVHYELMLVQGERQGSTCRYPVFQNHLLKRLSFLQHMFWVPLSKSDGCSFVDFCFGLLFYTISLSVCFSANIMPFYCYGSVIYFEVRYCDTSRVALFFAQYCLSYSGSLCIHLNFRGDFSISVEYHWNFDEDYIENIDCF
jgi:hypothetical protein